jgi:hypothetical protein
MDPSQSGDGNALPGNALPGNVLPGNVLPGNAKPPSAADSPVADSAGPFSMGWDHSLAAALHDVPLPAGLSARLLARLPEPAAPADGRSAVRPAGRAAGRRRWLQVAAASLACAASVTVAVLFFNQSTTELSGESVMESVRNWHKHQPAMLEPLRHEAPPEDYSPGSFVMPDCVVGWRPLPAPLLGRQGVAYQLVGPRQNRATLYVLDFDGPRSAPRLLLNTTSPLENLLTTDGQTSSTWTDGVRLYVLVSDGDEQDFRALVRAPRSMA